MSSQYLQINHATNNVLIIGYPGNANVGAVYRGSATIILVLGDGRVMRMTDVSKTGDELSTKYTYAWRYVDGKATYEEAAC